MRVRNITVKDTVADIAVTASFDLFLETVDFG